MIISNSSPLIYLAKIKHIHLLQELFGTILIPVEVKTEIVDEGKRRGEADAFRIEQEIAAGWIKIDAVHTMLKCEMNIHFGEKAALSLARDKNQRVVLLDDMTARAAARMFNLEPRGTISVLLLALKQKKINFDEFLHLLTQLTNVGFRLREEVYSLAVEEARRLSKK